MPLISIRWWSDGVGCSNLTIDIKRQGADVVGLALAESGRLCRMMFSGIRGEIRATLGLATPIVVGLVASHAMQVVDAVMIGHIGVDPLAGAAFGGNLFMICLLFVFGLGTAMTVMIGEAHGAGSQDRAREVLRHGLLIGSLAAGLLTVIFPWIVLKTDWWHLGQPAEVLAEAGPYLIYLSATLLPLYAFICLKSYSDAMGHPWVPLLVSLSGIVVNMGLNWVFIYGNLGVPRMELEGAGLATLIARFYLLAVMWAWLAWKRTHPVRWGIREFFGVSWRAKWNLVKLSVPISLQIVFEVLAFNGVAFLMGWFEDGARNVAAHAIAINCAAMAFMVPLGVGFAVTIRIGQAQGEGNGVRSRQIAMGGVGVSTVFMVGVALFFVWSREWLPFLFLSNDGSARVEQVHALASLLLIYAAAFAVFDGLQTALIAALRGYRDVRIPTMIIFIAYWLVCLPLGFFLGFGPEQSGGIPAPIREIVDTSWGFDLGPVGLWIGLVMGLLLIALALSARLAWLLRHLKAMG